MIFRKIFITLYFTLILLSVTGVIQQSIIDFYYNDYETLLFTIKICGILLGPLIFLTILF